MNYFSSELNDQNKSSTIAKYKILFSIIRVMFKRALKLLMKVSVSYTRFTENTQVRLKIHINVMYKRAILTYFEVYNDLKISKGMMKILCHHYHKKNPDATK